MAAIAPDRNLLFGLLALQNGLINQGQLVAAFQAWTLDKARALADHLVGRGDLDADDRSVVDALVAHHLKKHGGDVEKSLAALPTGRSTRAKLAGLGDPQIDATLAHVGAGSSSPECDADPDRTGSYSVGAATSDAQLRDEDGRTFLRYDTTHGQAGWNIGLNHSGLHDLATKIGDDPAYRIRRLGIMAHGRWGQVYVDGDDQPPPWIRTASPVAMPST
jgi:hypothetical protein